MSPEINACSMSCESITISQCNFQSYSMTGFPNFFYQISQANATKIAGNIDLAVMVNCYQNTREFLCRLLVPECRENQGLVLPNRQICREFYAGCEDRLRETGYEELIYDCDIFPEDPHPVCSDQPVIQAMKPCSTPCEAITISQCTSQSYSMTGFPNFFYQTSQAAAANISHNIDVAVMANCYSGTKEFLCGLLLPECRENEGLLLPNRPTCEDFYAGCGKILREKGYEELIFDCSIFSENPEPVCYTRGEYLIIISYFLFNNYFFKLSYSYGALKQVSI